MSEYELGNRLTKQIAKLQAEIEQHRWIPVVEGPPEYIDDPTILHSDDVWIMFSGKAYVGYYDEGYWIIYGSYCEKEEDTKNVTHWKPIILPKGGNDE